MELKRIYNRIQAALLIAGSAVLVISCGGSGSNDEIDPQELITQQSENLVMINSKNGVRSYKFTTPLLERYELAKEPYMEFRKGIKVETYNDSTQLIESTLTANYAIFLEHKQLWEAKGNVVGTNANGQKLETQQLFWDQVTGKVYSNVDSKVTQGQDVIIGTGFVSDETFNDFTFNKPKGKIEVDVEPRDTTKRNGASGSQEPGPAGQPASTAPVQPSSAQPTKPSSTAPAASSSTPAAGTSSKPASASPAKTSPAPAAAPSAPARPASSANPQGK